MNRWECPKDAMPWVVLYASGASLICTLAMAADAFEGFRQQRLWFPCRFFTINAVSITLIAIAMKLPVDLTTDIITYRDLQAKEVSIYFLVTMLANFLPSLGLMGDKDLLTNIIAFGILIVTITVNVLIQLFTGSVYNPFPGRLLFTILFPLSVSLIVPTCRRILERRYKELNQSDSTCEINFSYKELVHNIKKYWIMAETGNPQFVITSSCVSYAYGAICLLVTIISVLLPFQHHDPKFNRYRYRYRYQCSDRYEYQPSDYKWSMTVIVMVQASGVVLGSIAPIFRCITSISHFNISRKWSMNHLNVFKVEKYWTQRLKQWKCAHVHSHIPGRHLKIVFNSLKNMILNFCIGLQITLVVIFKTISLVPRCFIILLSCCWRYLCLPLMKRCKEEQNASESNVRSEIEEYAGYVLRFEEESQLSKRLLKNMLNSITKLIHKYEMKEPTNLLKLLEKSTGFNGVLEFDTNHDPQENQNSWSLVAVTLTSIAIALPNIEKSHAKDLLAGMREGLQFVTHIEENLNANTEDLVKARKSSRRLWTEIEVYNKWLQIDLQKNACNRKTSKATLQWLGEKAVKVVERFKISKKDALDHSEHKLIAASSMIKIIERILREFDEQENWPTDEETFDRISTLNADILCACFTNLPRVIKMKCHHDAIEKREDGIRAAAQLLGKSKKILKILKSRQLPKIDSDSMAYIDKWRALPKCQVPSGGVFSVGIHEGTSSSNKSLSVTIMK